MKEEVWPITRFYANFFHFAVETVLSETMSRIFKLILCEKRRYCSRKVIVDQMAKYMFKTLNYIFSYFVSVGDR